MNIVWPILNFGRTRESAPALVEGDRTVTYGELSGLVRRTSRHLSGYGIRRGDRVGLCLKDGVDQVVTFLAVAHSGAVAVALDRRARPAENARFVQGLNLARVIVEPDGRSIDDGSAIHLDGEWHRSVAQAEAIDEPVSEWQDPFAISATSGSTGAPKFTLMTHIQYYSAVGGMIELMALSGSHRYLCTLPFYYSGGRNSCIAHLLRGDCVVLYPSVFSPAEYIDVINRQRITVAAVVPSVVRQLLTISGNEPLLPGLATLYCSGAPLYADEKRLALRKLTPNFCERYGTAETLAIAVLRPADFADRIDSVGQPHSLVQIEVVDESDRPLPSGGVGRLRIRGPGIATPLPGFASEANFRNGCYYPGEIGRLDDAGYIFLLGRTSDVILRNGAKIYPAEIEATLVEHPLVLEAAVIGCRGADNEEIVLAFVTADKALLAGDLLAHCRTRLTPHKVPRKIHFLEYLPKNTAGKIDKIALGDLTGVASRT